MIVTEFKATKSHPQTLSKRPLDLPKVVLKLAYGPLFQLEDKVKLKPINWVSTNTIWSANFTKHWALIYIKEIASTQRISHPPFDPYALHIIPSFFENICPVS